MLALRRLLAMDKTLLSGRRPCWGVVCLCAQVRTHVTAWHPKQAERGRIHKDATVGCQHTCAAAELVQRHAALQDLARERRRAALCLAIGI
jgi:hypothetical protein